MHGPSEAAPKIDNKNLSLYAIEVLARLNETIDAVEKGYREYEFNSVAQRLYEFFWSDYCDWFVEAAKTEIFADDAATKRSALVAMDIVLSAVLRLLHPFMPHITEELWSLLGFGAGSIQFAPLPAKIEFGDVDLTKARKGVSAIYELVQAGRNLRAEGRVPSNKKANFILRTDAADVESELPTIARLMNAEEVKLDRDYKAAAGAPVAVTSLGEIILIVSGGDKIAERDRLDKEIANLEAELRTVDSKLSNKPFVDRAPAAVVEEHRRRKKDFSEQLAKLRQARGNL
jgi:valyl-tRNA synthetase